MNQKKLKLENFPLKTFVEFSKKKKLTKKNKIYFFHPYSGMGGADLSISRLINGIDHKNYDIDFLSLNYPKIKNKIKVKIKYKIFKSKRTIFAFKKINDYLANDNEYRKKIFISNQSFANTLSSCFLYKRKNMKLILFERNHLNELSYFKSINEFIKNLIIKILIKFTYKGANLVLTNSKESSEDLKKFSNCNVKTLYNPCFFRLYKKKKIKKKKLIILNVARFEDQKDHFTLIKGFAKAKFNHFFELHLFGYGNNLKKISRFIKDNNLNNIKIFNKKFNLKNNYSKADLFILSSLYEGFPNVLVEAASYRIPIISSNFKSGAKEILLNGRAGNLFNCKDYIGLSLLIDKFYLKREDFIKKEKICSSQLMRFSNKKIVKEFNNLLNRL